MKTFEIKTLMFVAAVACLPIACGTTSVTGPDAASLAGPESTVSALHHGDPLPPTAPGPSSPHTAPVPSTPTGDDVKPETPGVTPHTAPMPTPTADPGTPAPAPECLAVSVEIAETPTFFAGYPTVSLVATLSDKSGTPITDSSCDKLDWQLQAAGGDSGNTPPGASAVLTVDASNRHFATLSGPAGIYKVGTAAPNGATASRLVTLP